MTRHNISWKTAYLGRAKESDGDSTRHCSRSTTFVYPITPPNLYSPHPAFRAISNSYLESLRKVTQFVCLSRKVATLLRTCFTAPFSLLLFFALFSCSFFLGDDGALGIYKNLMYARSCGQLDSFTRYSLHRTPHSPFA